MKYLGEISEEPEHKHPVQDFEGLLDCQIAYNEYGGYCIPNDQLDLGIVQKIMRGDVYERSFIERMRDEYNGGSIVHAGAYFGDMLPALSRICEDGKVYAFEPYSENYQCAKATVVINGLENVELYNLALSDKSEEKDLLIRNEDGESIGVGASLTGREIEERTEKVHTVTVDEMVIDTLFEDPQIDILHLDVEGVEREALEGSMETIKTWKPLIIVENIPDKDKDERRWLKENLYPLGYEIDYIRYDGGNDILKVEE